MLFFLIPVATALANPSLPPPLVGFLVAQPTSLTITDNLPGRLASSKDSVVRARVAGIVEERLFTEGAFVHKGDVLFKIDDRPFKADLQSAKGALARAVAQKKLNVANVKRYRSLATSKTVSRQILDQAEATLATTAADIEIAKAAVTKAQINLDYTTVRAPISGFIGQQEVTVGALVSAATATQMAQIRQVDPLYVNVQQSATNISVPNPDHFLMPGLYVRVEMPLITLDNVFLIPQEAITRTDRGNTLFVLNDDNTFSTRLVEIARSWKNDWIVTGGLQPKDKVIVDGMLKVHMMHAQKVNPVPLAALRNPAAGQTQQSANAATPAAEEK